MSSRLKRSSLAIGVCLALALWPQQPRQQLLIPGQYHGDEVWANSGERWLALVGGQRGDCLVPGRLKVVTVRDEIVDSVPGTSTGKVVSMPGLRRPARFMISGLPGVTAGPVETAAVDSSLAPNDPLLMRLSGGKEYRLTLACDERPGKVPDESVSCTLVLSREGRTQVLATYTGYYEDGKWCCVGNDAMPHVLWAGDLNKDGRLDLLVDLTDHYNAREPALLISTEGTTDDLVKVVAQLRSLGC